MMPIRLVVEGPVPVRVPVAVDPFWIGRDPSSDLCLWDLRISLRHAKIGLVRGEYVLSAEGRQGAVWVNGQRAPMMPLRTGDTISLTPPEDAAPLRLRFENELEGAFVPPEASLASAWSALKASRGEIVALDERYELLEPLAGPGPAVPSRARDRESGRFVALKALSPVPLGPRADGWLRLLTALAGTTHASLMRVVDGGIVPEGPDAIRWIATEFVRGRPASVRIAEGPQLPITVAARLRGLGRALGVLHARGVVHGAVTPSHVILRPDGGARLVGVGHAFIARDGPFPASGLPVEAGFSAPEGAAPGAHGTPASDVYGLAAVARAMLAGGDPSRRGEAAPVPPDLEAILTVAMDVDPGARPTPDAVADVCAAVEEDLAREAT